MQFELDVFFSIPLSFLSLSPGRRYVITRPLLGLHGPFFDVYIHVFFFCAYHEIEQQIDEREYNFIKTSFPLVRSLFGDVLRIAGGEALR